MKKPEDPVFVEPLSEEDGGGFVATVPDLPGCMSDGETPQKAMANVDDAIRTRIEAAQGLGHNIPTPSRRFALSDSATFLQRLCTSKKPSATALIDAKNATAGRHCEVAENDDGDWSAAVEAGSVRVEFHALSP